MAIVFCVLLNTCNIKSKHTVTIMSLNHPESHATINSFTHACQTSIRYNTEPGYAP